MTEEQVAALGTAFCSFLALFRRFFARAPTFEHLRTYCRGLLSDLPRKSVEPIALSAGCAVRTLQEFLTFHRWDHRALRDQLQRRVAAEHLPAPGVARAKGDLGVIGLIDETSVAKKGDKTPGVQRQHCGASGKIDNCIVTVHLGVRHGDLLALLDSDLFLPEHTWHEDRARCREAHIPDEIVYRPKSQIALEQVRHAIGNGIRFDWLVFDEWYGSKPQFLFDLDGLGQCWVGEVPKNFPCFSTFPRYRSPRAPYTAKRADSICRRGKRFIKQPWRRFSMKRQTLAPQVWEVRAAQVWLKRDGRPTDRTYWLIVARNVHSAEVKYFLSNAPPKTALSRLLKVAFSRWGIEHIFRLAKTEIGFSHFEGRSYRGLLRHMTLCQLVMLFLAEQTTKLRGEKSSPVRVDNGADGPGIEHALSPLAGASSPLLVG
jgi:SRSO17 transposase